MDSSASSPWRSCSRCCATSPAKQARRSTRCCRAQAGRAIVAVDVDQHNDAPSSYQLQLRPADAAFFRTFIQTPGASLRRPPDDAIATSLARRNIEDVRRAVTRKFRDDYDDSARASFTAFARRHARVLVVSSDDFDYAYQIFLTINDRGKRLSVEDIFRGEILGPLDAGQRQRYETLIDEMDKYREQSAQPPSKGKTFFSHLAAIHGWRSRGIIAGLKRTVQRRGGPKRFVGEIFEPMAEAYLRIKGSAAALPLTREIEERLVLLRWLELHGDDDWVAPAMLGLVRYPDDHQRLATLLDGLDRFAHGLALMGCGRDARRKLYAPVLKALGSAAPIPDLDAVFALKLDDQRQIMQRVATRLHQADPPSVRLLLLRADHWLTGRPLTYYEPLIAPARTAGERFTVEHVCPQGDVEAGEWTQLFPDKRQRSAASQCIGNLALVTETQNKRMNQHPFAHKTKVLFDGPASTPFALTDMLGDEPVWDAAAIERRYSVIMTAVVGIWGLTAAIPPCPAST